MKKVEDEKAEAVKKVVKFGKKVADNITAATQLENHLKTEYQKAQQQRVSLVESVLLSAGNLETLEGYQIDKFDLEKGEAILVKTN